MNFTVDYKSRSYGTGSNVKRFEATVEESTGYTTVHESPDMPSTAVSEGRRTREVKFKLQCEKPASGRGKDGMGDADVLGLEVTLTHSAARALAQALLNLTDQMAQDPEAKPFKFQLTDDEVLVCRRSPRWWMFKIAGSYFTRDAPPLGPLPAVKVQVPDLGRAHIGLDNIADVLTIAEGEDRR